MKKFSGWLKDFIGVLSLFVIGYCVAIFLFQSVVIITVFMVVLGFV